MGFNSGFKGLNIGQIYLQPVMLYIKLTNAFPSKPYLDVLVESSANKNAVGL